MFGRRLRILLLLLLLVAGALIARVVQLQVFRREQFAQAAAGAGQSDELIETTRGRLLDWRGRVIAADEPCIDAAVDYRAVTRQPDPAWLRQVARQRLLARDPAGHRALPPARQRAALDEEIARVRADLERMWHLLAEASGQSVEQIDDVRAAIERRVEMRRRLLWYRRYQSAVEAQSLGDEGHWLRRFLVDPTLPPPDPDRFILSIDEQARPHVVLRDVSPEANARLFREMERCPGLSLVPSVRRVYPFGATAAHVVGYLAPVTRDDLLRDPNVGDERRQYFPNDLIGRQGLEALAEGELRGTRGSIAAGAGEVEPIAGRDVRAAIDMDLQADIARAFEEVQIRNPDGTADAVPMHGAAVVIDVASGQVRALVSVPTFDPNHFREAFPALQADRLGRPLMNRATQFALVPGSTVKPIVGLAGIAEGVIGVTQGIECTGYLVLGGTRYDRGRCWVATLYEGRLGRDGVRHHPIPTPHVGSAGNPDGHLHFAEALERSCNVYFETVADRLGMARLDAWFGRFGIGEPTGVGLPEARGRRPGGYRGPAFLRRSVGWFSAIGQGEIAATPLQMAQVAATIARDGVWVQPTLLETQAPRVVDLHLPSEALAAAREGMTRVVNSPAGTGRLIARGDVTVAGKTGTAEASPFDLPLLDDAGRPVRDAEGNLVRRRLDLSTRDRPNPAAPWYRGTGPDGDDLNHAWFIGFAPAERPTIAFAVLVEYGGSGGYAAGSVVQDLLAACIEHGYLPRRSP